MHSQPHTLSRHVCTQPPLSWLAQSQPAQVSTDCGLDRFDSIKPTYLWNSAVGEDLFHKRHSFACDTVCRPEPQAHRQGMCIQTVTGYLGGCILSLAAIEFTVTSTVSLCRFLYMQTYHEAGQAVRPVVAVCPLLPT